MSPNGLVHLDVQVIRQEREKAIQVVLEDGTIHWLPKSLLTEEYEAGERNLTISIPEWLAIEKGLA